MEIATIGFTQSSAERFFERLKRARVERLVDIRLSNTSQLAGFTRAGDLAYFLDVICQAGYEHEPRLAPTKELFDGYKKRGSSWESFEQGFLSLMRERRMPDALDRAAFERKTVLLCSEPRPDHSAATRPLPPAARCRVAVRTVGRLCRASVTSIADQHTIHLPVSYPMTATNWPPAAVRTTTSQGGSFQKVSRPKAARARLTSSADSMALVQTGW
jgi:hypothetical protein